MDNLKYFTEGVFFDNAVKFFKEINIPVNSIESQPFLPKDFLKNTYNPESSSHSLIDKIYFLGLVDDDGLLGKKSKETLEEVDKISNDYEGLAVVGVELKSREKGLLPTRSQLAEITRAINREFLYTPVTVLFRYGNFLALSNAERTSYLVKYKEGEKVGKVSLLRDISILHPHSGHLQIINSLKVPASVDSFKALDKHWNEVFSVSLLNKKFYKELSNWYFWAIKEVRFPGEPTQLDASDKGKSLTDLLNEHRATNVIRLLTRLLFVWFLKEKKLIPEELFDKDFLDRELLKDLNIEHSGLFKNNQKSTYYRAILQNLFFASLNCPIKPTDKNDTRERGFRKDDNYGQHRGADFLMRYQKEFKNPDLFLKLINQCVPFLNGGLFDCLDQKEDKIFIDGFSDNLTGGNLLIVPDYLFFGLDETIDLSAEYGLKDKKTKESAVKGLIRLLKSYKFTIDENTPVEEDVALDPELLGKVFENLLASYNPETKTTARKQTGSFYTPREIVNYMVDESLKEYLKTKMLDGGLGYLPFGTPQTELFGNEDRKGQLKLETDINPYTNDEEGLAVKLNTLFSYTEEQPFTDEEEIKKLISAIDACKILDPACGSGAFPMGILQKMVHVLQKLDPENRHWKDFQKHKALVEMDEALETLKDEERAERIADIEKSFDENINNPDYARKLFLIENCIYGVDIQPIATQISRLRFFISLVVDQKPSAVVDNFGIRPLPNLEAKFVTANTLIGIEKPKMESLFDKPEVKILEGKLKEVRHRLFSAKTSRTKRNLKKRDEELRNEIAELLSEDIGNENAKLLSSWNPYDQNSSAPFFDPEWMFGLSNKNGGFFDISIANPPYINVEMLDKEIKDFLYHKYITCKGRTDIYIAFLENTIDILKKKGVLTFIIPYPYTNQNYGSLSRKMLIENHYIKEVVDTSEYFVFDNANVKNIILNVVKGKNSRLTKIIKVSSKENFEKNIFSNFEVNQNLFLDLKEYRIETKNISEALNVKRKIEHQTIKLEDIMLVAYGARLNHKSKKIGKENYLHSDFSEGFKPYIEGKDIEKYVCNQNGWLNYKPNEHYNSMFVELFETEKIVFINVVKDQLRFALDQNHFYNSHTVINCVRWSDLQTAKHITVRKNINLEKVETSKNYSYEFLLGLLNSKLINWYFVNFQSEGLHFYPDDAKRLPIPFINQDLTYKIARLVQELLELKQRKIDTEHHEKQIDLEVYKLFQLTFNEAKIIDNALLEKDFYS